MLLPTCDLRYSGIHLSGALNTRGVPCGIVSNLLANQVLFGHAGWICEGLLAAGSVWPVCNPGPGCRHPPSNQVVVLFCPALPCAALPCTAPPSPFLSCYVLPCTVLPSPVLPCLTLPCPILPCAPSLLCPALSCYGSPCQTLPTLSCLAVFCHALPCFALSCFALPCPVLPCPVVTCPSLPRHVLLCPVVPCPVVSCPLRTSGTWAGSWQLVHCSCNTEHCFTLDVTFLSKTEGASLPYAVMKPLTRHLSTASAVLQSWWM